MYLSPLFVSLLLVGGVLAQQYDFAVYTLTQGTPNQITVLAGNSSSGLVKVINKVNSGGNGVPTGSPRGLESQHPIVVYQNYLFAVNTGSGSVSMFTINSSDPSQISLLSSQPSGGDWPLSLTVWGRWVCVANGGTINGIRCFTFSSSGLTIIPSWDRTFGQNLTLPPAFHTGPAQISFMPDGYGLIVSIKSNDPPVLLWKISVDQLSSNATAMPTFGNVPFGFIFDVYDYSSFVITDPAPTAEGVSGVALITVNYGFNPSFSYKANYTLIPNQHGACWIEQNPSNGHFFVANTASNDISEVSLSDNALTLVKDYPLPSTITPTDMAIAKVGNTQYLFAESGGSQLLIFSLASAGNAQLIQTVDMMPTTTYGGGVAVYVVQSSPSPSSSSTSTSSASSSSSSSSSASSSTSAKASTTSSSSSSSYLSVGFSFIVAIVSSPRSPLPSHPLPSPHPCPLPCLHLSPLPSPLSPLPSTSFWCL